MSSMPTHLSEPPISPISPPQILKRGDRDPAVRTLRLLLASSQRTHWPVPGQTLNSPNSFPQSSRLEDLGDRFTPEVEQWVKIFQKMMFLPVDGIVGPDTWRALCADAPVHLSQLELGDRGSEVQLLQQHLVECHQFLGRVNGVFGPCTEAAVKLFQRHQGLFVDGIVGLRTWDALSFACAKAAQ